MNLCLKSFFFFGLVISYQILTNFIFFKIYYSYPFRSKSIMVISSEWDKNHSRPASRKQNQRIRSVKDGETEAIVSQEMTLSEETLITAHNVSLESSNPFSNLSLVLKPNPGKFCASKSTLVIAFVKSAVPYQDRRQRIRMAWANKTYYHETNLEVVFVLGRVKDPKVQEEVKKEAALHGDIIQMNYQDTYSNLIYKVMAGFIWVKENCLHPRWVLEVDDDVLMNPFEMNAFLQSELEDPNTSIIIGHLLKRSRTQREGKWALTQEEFANYWFPPFVNGGAYFVGRTIVPTLIRVAKQTPIIPLDDVFFTGLVAEKANIRRLSISNKYIIATGRKIFYRQGVIFYIERAPAIFTFWKHNWNKIVTKKGHKIT